MKKRGMAIVLAAAVIGMSVIAGSSTTVRAADEAGIRRRDNVCSRRQNREAMVWYLPDGMTGMITRRTFHSR